MKESKEYTPWLALASAILRQAYKDALKNNSYSKDAMMFLDSEWGQYLYQTVSDFEKISNEDMKKLII